MNYKSNVNSIASITFNNEFTSLNHDNETIEETFNRSPDTRGTANKEVFGQDGKANKEVLDQDFFKEYGKYDDYQKTISKKAHDKDYLKYYDKYLDAKVDERFRADYLINHAFIKRLFYPLKAKVKKVTGYEDYHSTDRSRAATDLSVPLDNDLNSLSSNMSHSKQGYHKDSSRDHNEELMDIQTLMSKFENLFTAIDKEKTGSITWDEFSKVLIALTPRKLNKSDVMAFLQSQTDNIYG